MIILCDQDGVLAYFELGFFTEWRRQFPDEAYVPVENRTTFYPRDEYPASMREKVESIYHAPGFYRHLPPVPGGAEALKEMLRLGHEVFICTAPLSRYEHCVIEKYQWVEEHLGREFVKRIMLVSDKTLIYGNVLIDDKPSVRGAREPDWAHVLYDAPYNRGILGKERLTWRNWRQVLRV